MLKEKRLATLILNFPNLIDKALRRMPLGELGQVNVCLKEACFPFDGGRIDLAFVTDQKVHLVELKKDVLDEATLRQLLSYQQTEVDPSVKTKNGLF